MRIDICVLRDRLGICSLKNEVQSLVHANISFVPFWMHNWNIV